MNSKSLRRRGRAKGHFQKLNSKIIAVVAIIIILSVAIVAYIHYSKPAVAIPSVPATVSVDPSSILLQNAEIGQTIQVNINVTNVRNLWGWELNYLTFNPKVLNLTQVQEGPFLKTGGPTFFITTLNDTNWLQAGILPSTNEAINVNATAHGSGVILSLTFAVLAAGTSPIIINSASDVGGGSGGSLP